MLSQILSVGTLFTQKALVGTTEDKNSDSEEEDEDHLVDDQTLLTPEELRREIYENLLKRRIFFADRQEKIEKVLITLGLISKDFLYCIDEMLVDFKNSISNE